MSLQIKENKFEQKRRQQVPEHGHGEPLGEHVHDECPQGFQAGQLMGQVHSAGLLPQLEKEDPCVCGETGWDGELNQLSSVKTSSLC